MKAYRPLGQNIFLAFIILGLFTSCISGPKVINGAAKWNKKTEKRPLEVHGAFGGDNLQLHSLVVFGTLNLKNSRIERDLTVYGFATLDNVQVGGSLKTNGLSLNNCTTKDIAVNTNHEALVKISGVTSVDGELHFTRTKGLVQVSENTSLSGGIVNGVIEDAKPPTRTGPIVDGKERANSPN